MLESWPPLRFSLALFLFNTLFAFFLQTNFAIFPLGKKKRGRNNGKYPASVECSVFSKGGKERLPMNDI